MKKFIFSLYLKSFLWFNRWINIIDQHRYLNKYCDDYYNYEHVYVLGLMKNDHFYWKEAYQHTFSKTKGILNLGRETKFLINEPLELKKSKGFSLSFGQLTDSKFHLNINQNNFQFATFIYSPAFSSDISHHLIEQISSLPIGLVHFFDPQKSSPTVNLENKNCSYLDFDKISCQGKGINLYYLMKNRHSFVMFLRHIALYELDDTTIDKLHALWLDSLNGIIPSVDKLLQLFSFQALKQFAIFEDLFEPSEEKELHLKLSHVQSFIKPFFDNQLFFIDKDEKDILSDPLHQFHFACSNEFIQQMLTSLHYAFIYPEIYKKTDNQFTIFTNWSSHHIHPHHSRIQKVIYITSDLKTDNSNFDHQFSNLLLNSYHFFCDKTCLFDNQLAYHFSHVFDREEISMFIEHEMDKASSGLYSESHNQLLYLSTSPVHKIIALDVPPKCK